MFFDIWLRFGAALGSFVLERALATVTPEYGRLISFFTAQSCCDGEECTEEDGAVIVGQFNQFGLHDQSAELDQMPRALLALDHNRAAPIDGWLLWSHQNCVTRLSNLMFAPLLLVLAAACSNGGANSSQSSPEAAVSSPSISLTGRVTDAAKVLTDEQEAGLSAKLQNLELATGHQMVVVTVPTLGGRDVAAFTRDLANSWGIGRTGYDDGGVLLVAPNERKARIEVGYGLEKTLPNSLCQQIMDKQMIPRFREGDLAGGLDAGVDALSSRLREQASTHSP